MKKNYFSLLATLILFSIQSYAQLTITPAAANLTTLQNNLLGTGVHITNITYYGVPNSFGTFSGTSNLGISNGLILSTGTIMNIDSPASYFMSDGAAGPGDPVLQTIANGTTQDAAVLEFDFEVQGDSVKFNFVFGSEEYSDYANSGFNDVFGFFISGPGITGNQNIALVPGTTTNVSINNVNNGYSLVGIVPTGPCMNCAYFNDNTNGTTVAFDAFTTPITAVSAVLPCTTYHIRLSVANVNDGAFDSGVFLEANSFTACPLNVFNGLAPIVDTLSFCYGSSLTLSTGIAPNYLWNTGATTQSITVTQPGNYNVTINSGSCFASSSQIVVVTDTAFVKPMINQNGPVLNSSITNLNYTYEWYKDGVPVFNSNNPLLNVSSGGCYQVMITDVTGCTETSDSLCVTFAGINNNDPQPFSLSISPNPVAGDATITFVNEKHENFELQFFDVTGKKMMEIQTSGNQVLLMKNSLSPGVYILQLENVATGSKAKIRFVIN